MEKQFRLAIRSRRQAGWPKKEKYALRRDLVLDLALERIQVQPDPEARLEKSRS